MRNTVRMRRSGARPITRGVIHGDCRTVLRSLPTESVDLVLTDPPYGVRYRAVRAAGQPDHPWRSPMLGDERFDDALYTDWLGEAYRVLRPDRHIYMFCADRHLGTVRRLVAEAGFTLKRTLVWEKPTWPPGDTQGDYGHTTELCVYAMKGRRLLAKPRIGNVLHYPRVPHQRMLHPTEKPVEMLRVLIRKSAPPGGLVLDPFAGSGSTGEAAYLEGCDSILIEADPQHATTAANRLATLLRHAA